MLVNKHDCYTVLNSLKASGADITEDLHSVISDNIVPKSVITELVRTRSNDVINFYLNLNNKAHKVIKEILTCEGKPISNYVKIATSLITQSIITIEHLYSEDINGQNNFIDCVGLVDLANGLSDYFSTGDETNLVKAVINNRNDVKSILD
jgi:hypothetical protein